MPAVHGRSFRRGAPGAGLHHSRARRPGGRHQLAAAPVLSEDRPRTAVGRAQPHLCRVRRLGSLRVADAGAGPRRDVRPLPIQLPATYGRHHAPALRARPQPLRAVLALRPHLRRDRGRARLGHGRSRHRNAAGLRVKAAVGRGRVLHKLRQVRAGLPYRRDGREGLGGRGDDEASGGREPPGLDARGRVMDKLKIGTCWLDGCSGCHMSLLDIDEGIVAVLEKADIVFGPLVDAQEWPEGVDVALIEGAVSSQDDLKLAQTARARSKFVVALGDCAVTGNVPSMRNGIPVRKLLERVYVEGADERPGVPTDGVPALLKQAEPLRSTVKVDVYVPGCPPKPNTILMVLSELLEGREPDLGSKVRFG